MNKPVLIVILFLITANLAWADFLGVYDKGNENADDSIWVYISMWDSLALKPEAPDTLFIYRFDPGGDTLTADTVVSLSSFNFASGFYMKRYRAGGQEGQYIVHAVGSGNGNYYSLADHSYYVNDGGIGDMLIKSDTPANWADMKITGGGYVSPNFDDINGQLDNSELASGAIHEIADSTRQLVWRTMLVPGYPGDGDTASALLYRIYTYVDGNGAGGIDADISDLNDIDSNAVYLAVLSALMADSATVDTGDGSYAHASLKSGSIPDSLLAMVAKLDTLYASVGRPGVSGETPSLHMKIGLGYNGQAGAGNNIKDDVAAIGATGGGAEPETLIVLSSTDSTKIQGARVTAKTVDQTTTKVAGLPTDVDGELILALDSGSYWLEITANNYNQTKDTITVPAGGNTDTLFMPMFDPGSPPDPGLCRVYGWVYDIGGDSLAGAEITAEIPRTYHPAKYDNVVITPYSKSTVTDSSGYWFLDLIPTSLLSNSQSKYMFTVKYQSGVIYRSECEVPDQSGWQLQ